MTAAFQLGPALLFCPADRPDRFSTAAERADAVILDLEDAVAPDRRPAARDAVARADLDPALTIVRINPLGTPDAAADLAALAATDFRRIMAPKADRGLVGSVPTGFEVIALCETASGVASTADLARADGVVAMMWGAEDLVASLGGTASRFPAGHIRSGDDVGGAYRDVARFARASVLIAAGAAGIAAIDTVHLDIDDLEGVRAEADDAAASGFTATACIHPKHVPVIREAYSPPRWAVDRARAVLDAATGQGGVFRFEGSMVDGPVLRHAETVLRRAGIGVAPVGVAQIDARASGAASPGAASAQGDAR